MHSAKAYVGQAGGASYAVGSASEVRALVIEAPRDIRASPSLAFRWTSVSSIWARRRPAGYDDAESGNACSALAV
jgi:hypothetical protein